LLGTTAATGDVPVRLLSRRVSLADLDAADVPGDPIYTNLAAGFTRARYVMTSQAAGRAFGPLTARIEHVWWRGRHLAGSRRLPASTGTGTWAADAAGFGTWDPGSAGFSTAWIDWLESNRSIDSHELRAHVEAGGAERNVSLTYGWIHSTDDTDGPFSFPAGQNDLSAERTRSAGTPIHTVDVAGSAALPGGVRATLIATLRGSSPYNVVTGLDAEGNGLQTDRGGRLRNSGDGPTYRCVSVYLHRRVDLSAIFGSRLKVPLDTGAQIDNLLGTRNWTVLGDVIGSPLFGRPEGALPGRTFRIWFTVAR